VRPFSRTYYGGGDWVRGLGMNRRKEHRKRSAPLKSLGEGQESGKSDRRARQEEGRGKKRGHPQGESTLTRKSKTRPWRVTPKATSPEPKRKDFPVSFLRSKISKKGREAS